MIITFHMHFISVHALLDQFPCLSLFDNNKRVENVYELIVTMFFFYGCWMVLRFYEYYGCYDFVVDIG